MFNYQSLKFTFMLSSTFKSNGIDSRNHHTLLTETSRSLYSLPRTSGTIPFTWNIAPRGNTIKQTTTPPHLDVITIKMLHFIEERRTEERKTPVHLFCYGRSDLRNFQIARLSKLEKPVDRAVNIIVHATLPAPKFEHRCYYETVTATKECLHCPRWTEPIAPVAAATKWYSESFIH